MSNKKLIFAPTAAIILGGILLLSPSASSAAADRLNTAQTTETVGANFSTLTSAQLAQTLSRKDFYLVNVHVPYEGEIKKTDAFIVYDKIAENLGKLPSDRKAKIVLYCRSGRMSEIAAQELARLGYKQVSHLGGGMIAWKRSGYELIEK